MFAQNLVLPIHCPLLEISKVPRFFTVLGLTDGIVLSTKLLPKTLGVLDCWPLFKIGSLWNAFSIVSLDQIVPPTQANRASRTFDRLEFPKLTEHCSAPGQRLLIWPMTCVWLMLPGEAWKAESVSDGTWYRLAGHQNFWFRNFVQNQNFRKCW